MESIRSVMMSLILSQLLVNAILSINPSHSITFEFPSFSKTNMFNIERVYQDSWYTGQNASYGDSALLLTPDPTSVLTHKYSNIGKFKYKDPIQFKNNHSRSPAHVVSFSTSFSFQIITTAPYGLCGSGMAFFIAAFDKAPIHSDGRYFGLLDPNATTASKFFAVEFDTHTSPNLDDPSASHIGIDINSLISMNVTDTSPNSSSPFYPQLYLYNNETFTAWIDYNSSTNLIQVWMTNKQTSYRPSKACVELSYNLSSVFEDTMYVGFSATNKAGEDSMEGHAVHSWSFTSEDILINPEKSMQTNLILPLAIALPILLLLGALGIASFLMWRWSKLRIDHAPSHTRSHNENSILQLGSGHCTLLRHSYKELKRSAQGFSNQTKIGEGGYSIVYRGTLEDGSVVAIKKLKAGIRKEAEFSAEMNIISSLSHRNLLQLRGWCYEKGEAMLVYDYMRNGSLESYLYGKKQGELQSGTRLKILVGVASALEYLHDHLGECVLHRDVKAANVLLTEGFEPKLCDFGHARLKGHDEGAVTMTTVGTPGYIAPEVIDTGKITSKADVYGFGVLTLEMAYGRPAITRSVEKPEETRLVNYVWMLHQKQQHMDALDPSMGNMDAQEEEQWRSAVHVALICCKPLPDARPTMRQVYQALKGDTMLLMQPLPETRPSYPTGLQWPSTPAPASASSEFQPQDHR